MSESHGRVGFFPAFFNLAETVRMLRIAKACRRRGASVFFFSHGGEYECLVEEADMEIRRVRPLLTGKRIEYLWKLFRMEVFGDLYSADLLDEHVRRESEAFASLGLDIVVTGFNLPCSLSARCAGVPLVCVMPATGLPNYYAAGLATYPEAFENTVTRCLPSRFKDRLTNWFAKRSTVWTRPFVTVGTPVAQRPPYRSPRAIFPHGAPRLPSLPTQRT